MLIKLTALLHRYFLTYFRFPKRVLGDFVLPIVMALALCLSRMDALSTMSVIIYILTLPFTFLVTVRSMLGEITTEKVSGIKEYLKLNGLSTFTYQLYIFIITIIKTLFFGCFIVAGIIVGGMIADSDSSDNFFQITIEETVFLYICCALGSTSFILFMSLFFSDPKIASSVGGLLYVVTALASLAVLSSPDSLYYYLVCLLPQTALMIGLFVSPDEFPISILEIMLLMIADFFLYLIFYVYL